MRHVVIIILTALTLICLSGSGAENTVESRIYAYLMSINERADPLHHEFTPAVILTFVTGGFIWANTIGHSYRRATYTAWGFPFSFSDRYFETCAFAFNLIVLVTALAYVAAIAEAKLRGEKLSWIIPVYFVRGIALAILLSAIALSLSVSFPSHHPPFHK